MAFGLEPGIKLLAGGFTSLATHIYWILPLFVIFCIGGIIWWFKKIRSKKDQWTHKLRIRRVLPGGLLSDPIYHKMRRFPLIKKAEVFELEKPVLGGYLIPELDEYSGINEFSIILDKNNRIYTNKGEFFDPDKGSLNVSAKHSEIDIQRQNLKSDFQNINKISKRIEWSTIAKYAFMLVAIMCVTIVLIVGLRHWGEAQQYKAQEAQAMANTMTQLGEIMDTVEATVNTQSLLTPKLKELLGTQNLQSLIKSEVKNVSQA